MIIDFHTHIFPDHIASQTVQKLEESGEVKSYLSGKKNDLLVSMKQANITYSVILPVVTRKEQFRSVNEWAAKINGVDGLFSFGGIHPDSLDYKLELEKIKAYGLKGIKLHPDYQNTYIDDDKYLRIITYALKLGLYITIHCGIDVSYPNNSKCLPENILSMLQAVEQDNKKEPKIILAHTGSLDCWDQVEAMLVGQNVWLDISFTLGRIKTEQFLRIMNKHGMEHILFATDSPWMDQKRMVELVENLPITKEAKDQIFWKNAYHILFS